MEQTPLIFIKINLVGGGIAHLNTYAIEAICSKDNKTTVCTESGSVFVTGEDADSVLERILKILPDTYVDRILISSFASSGLASHSSEAD